MLQNPLEKQFNIDFLQWDDEIADLSTEALRQQMLKFLSDTLKKNAERINRYLVKAPESSFYQQIPQLIQNDIARIERFRDEHKNKTNYDDRQIITNIAQDLLTSYENLLNQLLHTPPPPPEKKRNLYNQLQLISTLQDRSQPFGQLLEKIHSYRDQYNPQCSLFISYAWPSEQNKVAEAWVQPFLQGLRDHLQGAGIVVDLDIDTNFTGNNIHKFTEKVDKAHYVMLAGTPSLLEKHQKGVHIICGELNRIKNKRTRDVDKGLYLILPILLAGDFNSSFPVEYQGYTTIRDWQKGSYLFHLKNLIALIYEIGEKNEEYNNAWKEFAKAVHPQFPELVEDILYRPYQKPDQSHRNNAYKAPLEKKRTNVSQEQKLESENFLELASLEFEKKNYQEAINNLDIAIALNPNFASAYMNRGAVKRILAKDEEALEDLLMAYKLDSKDIHIIYNLAYTYEAIGDYDEAIKYFTLVTDYADDIYLVLDAQYQLGQSLAKQEKYEAALAHYDILIDEKHHYQGNLSAVYNSRGATKFFLKRYEDAKLDYEKAIELDSQNEIAHKNLENVKAKLMSEVTSKMRGHHKTSQVAGAEAKATSNQVSSSALLGSAYKAQNCTGKANMFATVNPGSKKLDHKEKDMLQQSSNPSQATATQFVPQVKPFFDNPYSAEAYLAEISTHWPEAFRELCIASEEAQPLIDYIKREFIDNKKISSDDVQWLLLCAAYYGSVNQVRNLIQQNFVNAKRVTEEKALTVMHIAALKGDIALVRELKKMSFSIHKAASFGGYQNVTSIHCAIISGNTEALSALDGRFSHVHYTLGSGTTDYIELGWLSLAAYAGQLEMLKKLLERYPQNLEKIAFVQGGFGGNILHIVIETFQREILAELLAHEFFRNINYLEGKNTHGLTPFALAAQLGNIDAMKILKDKGADVDMAAQSERFNSYTALHLAAEAGQHKAVQYLLLWGAVYTAACTPVPKPGKAIREYTAKALAAKLAREAAQEAENISEFTLRQYHIQKSDAYASIANDLEDFEINKDLTKFSPTSDKKVIYKNLVFKGGGPKGMVYAGALSKLLEKWEGNEELKNLSSIERVAGASAGAITAVLLAMGISPKKLHSFLTDKENDPKQFLEGKSLDLLSSKPASEKLLEATKNAGWYALHPMQLGGLFLHLCKDDWLCTGDVFLNWIEKKIREATGKEWCTFGELKEKIDSQSERKFRHLHVVTIRVSPNTQVEVLSSEDPRYQDYTIAHAIRASMSIPIVFKPAELYKTLTTADGQRQLVNTHDGLYVDGGVLANYPLKVFDTAGYVYQGLYGFRDDQSKYFPVYNEATLGFYILPEKALANPVYAKSGKLSMYSALQALYSSAEDRVHEFEQAGRRSIAIGNAGVTLYDFDLKPEQITALYQTGEQAVEHSPLITGTNERPRTATLIKDQQYATTTSTTTDKDVGDLTGDQQDLIKK